MKAAIVNMKRTVTTFAGEQFSRMPVLARWFLLLAVVVSGAGQVHSATCDKAVSVPLGKKTSVDSKQITELSSISSVSLTSTDKGFSCPAGSYSFTGNVLSTVAKCKGTFSVTGPDANCVQALPEKEVMQVPLFLLQKAEPNLMFILDDSGSMHFESMPDSLYNLTGIWTPYLYPRATGVYGGSDYDNYVVTFNPTDSYNARARSPQKNTIYYDPGVTYYPWKKSDGTEFDKADIQCALHNPMRVGTGANFCRDLTVDNTNYNNNFWVASTGLQTSATSPVTLPTTEVFWPAVYYWYNSGDETLTGSYTRVEIRPAQASYTGNGRENRDDCAVEGDCTYDEEIQNFANWYTYYRSRVLSARAGIGIAFAAQGAGLRVGFAAINRGSTSVDGVNTPVIIDGVRSFSGSDRDHFFSQLYSHVIPAAGTPLRSALDAAGQYFSRTDNTGPWSETPGTVSTKPHQPCRRCYSVLTTDGYWSGGNSNAAPTSAAQDNNDGTNGSAITNHRPGETAYTYIAASPFSDSRTNTLADIAMYYWKNDLRPTLDNIVSPTSLDNAYWQHMTTFGVGLGVTGSVNPEAAFAAIKDTSAPSISWPDPDTGAGNCSGATCGARIDDLLHAGVNSRGGFFSAADPSKLANDLAAVLKTIRDENRASSSAIATNSTRLDQGTLIYQASFNAADWSGQIRAYHPNTNGQVDKDKPFWDTDSAGTFAKADERNIFTSKGLTGSVIAGGVDFTWSGIGTVPGLQDLLKVSASDTNAEARLNWLRGDQSEDGELFRERMRILGDIVNSDPYFVGNVDYGNRNLSGDEGATYATFLQNNLLLNGKTGRTNMLYVGANDGMLHGFNALTGKELFAFIPAGIFAKLPALSSPTYEHSAYVDASPRAADAYFNTTWHTVLVGATGAGGRSVFALDVTDPDKVDANSVLWEFSTNSGDTDKLGIAIGQPSIARVKAGDQWVAIFSNGYESGDNVKLMVVDISNGKLLKAIDTGVPGTNNGLGIPVPVDINNDRITDYIYAGDLQGNVWRFDLTGNSLSNWSASKLFVAVDASNVAQPITARPAVGRHPDGGIMIYVGTGKYFQREDATVPTTPQIQTFYGIRDILDGTVVERSDLVEREIIFEGVATLTNGSKTALQYRAVSNNSDKTAPTHGWYLDLIPPSPAKAEGERVVSAPILRNGRIIFTTIIPTHDLCGIGGTSWLMELDAVTGGRFDYSVLDVNLDGKIDGNDYILVNGTYVPASGVGSGEMIKTPGIVSAGDVEYKYTSGSSGSIGVTREAGGGAGFGRQSWRQLQ